MLPWFVAVQEDEHHLELVEGGTWDELAASHRDFTAPRATPSGLPNRYGAIPYRFPASVELCGLGPISDALVCRRRWSSPAVMAIRGILLGADRELARAYIQDWRAKAIEIALAAFADIRAEEKRVFGKQSFYYHKERLVQHVIPMPVVLPDPDLLDEDSERETGVEPEV